ncbi:hypothetical protein [Elizabethkingia anophelis]|uniref:hypothetical protein n=1 Tax=Elizabethkingia anophelis TaxID=1117645 RepID=UPI003786F9F3
MSVKERLRAYIKFKGVKINSFEKTIGASNAYVNNIRLSIAPEKLEQIAKNYPDLNIEWLLTGNGEMISMEGKELDPNYSVPARRKDDTVTQVDSDEYMEVEYRDLSVAAGPLNRTSSGYKKRLYLYLKNTIMVNTWL